MQLSHGRHWGHIASFPSGHLIVTAALASAAAAAAPVLRRPLLAYVGLVALTRVLFGAHFPLDVTVGALLGHQLGLLAAAVARIRVPDQGGSPMSELPPRGILEPCFSR